MHDSPICEKIFVCSKNQENGPKMGKTCFLEFTEKFGQQFLLVLFYNKNLCYLLCFCTNPIFMTKMFLANEIAGFFNQPCL